MISENDRRSARADRRLVGVDLGIASDHTVRVLRGDGSEVCRRRACPARMSFTVINRVAMAHLHSPLAVVYDHDSPRPAMSPHQLSHRTRRSEAEPRQIVWT
jgi:hypothetical protein